MKACPEREVVVEIEHTTVVRKKASTKVRICPGCRMSTDFLLLTKAAELFELEPAKVFDFVRINSCHFIVGDEGEIYICLADLLAAMDKRIRNRKVELLGESK